MSQALPLVTRQATAFHSIPVIEPGKMVLAEMLARSEIPPETIGQLVFDLVVHIAREIVPGTGMSVHRGAYSVSRACATSFLAVANMAESLVMGTIGAGIAGGADSSSVLPIGVSKTLVSERFTRDVPGGSIACGHPFAVTGARMITRTRHELRRGGGFGGLCRRWIGGSKMVLEAE